MNRVSRHSLDLAGLVLDGLGDSRGARELAQRVKAALGRHTQTPRHPATVAAKVRRAERRKSAAERRREVYAAVDARSGGRCEAQVGMARCRNAAQSHDHFWGRAREESVESVWHLCLACDLCKTTNKPTRIAWLAAFKDFAFNNGYAAQVTKALAAIEHERAQHPAAEARR